MGSWDSVRVQGWGQATEPGIWGKQLLTPSPHQKTHPGSCWNVPVQCSSGLLGLAPALRGGPCFRGLRFQKPVLAPKQGSPQPPGCPGRPPTKGLETQPEQGATQAAGLNGDKAKVRGLRNWSCSFPGARAGSGSSPLGYRFLPRVCWLCVVQPEVPSLTQGHLHAGTVWSLSSAALSTLTLSCSGSSSIALSMKKLHEQGAWGLAFTLVDTALRPAGSGGIQHSGTGCPPRESGKRGAHRPRTCRPPAKSLDGP